MKVWSRQVHSSCTNRIYFYCSSTAISSAFDGSFWDLRTQYFQW